MRFSIIAAPPEDLECPNTHRHSVLKEFTSGTPKTQIPNPQLCRDSRFEIGPFCAVFNGECSQGGGEIRAKSKAWPSAAFVGV